MEEFVGCVEHAAEGVAFGYGLLDRVNVGLWRTSAYGDMLCLGDLP